MSSRAGTADKSVAGVFGRAAATFGGMGNFSHFGERLVVHAQVDEGDCVVEVDSDNERGQRQRFDTKDQLGAALQTAGFKDISIVPEDFNAVVTQGGWTGCGNSSGQAVLEDIWNKFRHPRWTHFGPTTAKS